MAAEKRTITIYNTVGQNKTTLESSAMNWEELQKELKEQKGINSNGMKVVIADTQNSLESPQAVLLQGPFSLLMMPQKVKSGVDIIIG